MATAILAKRGRFGSTDFYILTMPAKELVERLVIPKDLDGWEEMSIEERFQREVNYKRVKEHIAPYLANDEDRFFGAFIVDVLNADGVEFEPFSKVTEKIPKIYQIATEDLGFLHFKGNEVLTPLDGQHRLTALKFAITGKDEKGRDIPGINANLSVASDTCTVILMMHDPKKARKIFNKVNRYAKATSKADNLITADDDIVAILTREIVADKVIGERLVNYQSNTLSKNSSEFTTLSTIYEATVLYLEDIHGKIDRTTLPDCATQKTMRLDSEDFWSKIVTDISIFSQALYDKSDAGDEKRAELRAQYTICKPIVQLALVEAIIRLMQPEEDGTRISWNIVKDRVNALDWGVDNSLWQQVLMNGEKVITGKSAAKFAARFIAYLLGEKLHLKEKEALEKQFKENFPKEKQPSIILPPKLY